MRKNVARRPDGMWRARYSDPTTGKQIARHFRRKEDAKQWLDEVTAELVTGTYVAPSSGRVTVKAHAEAWRTSQTHRPSTAAQVETNLRLHVYPTLGDRQIGQVRPSEVQAWVKGLGVAGLAPGTIEVIYRYLSAVFAAAVEDSLIRSNPCRGAKLPKVEPRKVVPLTVPEVWALVDAAPPRYRATTRRVLRPHH